MELGFVGLGKMGSSIVHRIERDSDHAVVAFDLDRDAVGVAEAYGATGAETLEGLVGMLARPRTVWVMVPSGEPTERTVKRLGVLLEPGDTVVDGGSSNWHDDVRRASELDAKGIEYGLMEAYAEGFELMHMSAFPIELREVARLWNQGSVVRSWLLELAENASEAAGDDLAEIRGYAADSGEGRWTVQDGIDRDVPMPAIAAAVYARFYSRGEGDFAARFIAGLRGRFGGHMVKRAIDQEPV